MNRNPICKYLLHDGIMLCRILPVVRRNVRATLAMQYCFCNVGIINCRVWRINIPFMFDEDREFRDDGLLRLVRYPSKLSLLFGWFLRRERSVSGIGGQTEAYEVNHCAHLLKICRCDDASVRDIFDSPSNAAGRVRNISLNASIMGQIHNPWFR